LAWRASILSGVPLPGPANALNQLFLARVRRELGQWQHAWEVLQRRHYFTLGLAEWLELQSRVATALGYTVKARAAADHRRRLKGSRNGLLREGRPRYRSFLTSPLPLMA
jgi:hypothetical protein